MTELRPLDEPIDASRLRALADVGRLLSETLDPEMVGRRVVEAICALLAARAAALYRLDQETGRLEVIQLSRDTDQSFYWTRVLGAGFGLAGLAVLERRPLVSSDVLRDPRLTYSEEMRARIGQSECRALISVPLEVKDRMFGALAVGDSTGRVFGEGDVRLAQAFADQAALALENARLFAEGDRRRREAEALARIAAMLTESLDLHQVAERIVQTVTELFSAPVANLRLCRPDGGLTSLVSRGIPRDVAEQGATLSPGVGLIARAVSERRAVWSADVLNDPRVVVSPALRRLVVASGVGAMLAAPLRVKGTIIGVLSLADTGLRPPSEALPLLQAFADQAALALENARLFSLETARRTQMETLAAVEKEIAAELDSDRLLGLIVERSSRLFEAKGVIFLIDDGGLLVPQAWTDAHIFGTEVVGSGQGLVGRCAEAGQGLLVNDYPAWSESLSHFVEAGVRHAMVQPLIMRDRMLGIIAMNRIGTEAPPFQPDNLVTLERFATQAAIALENARLYQETARGRREAEIVADLARTINASRDLDLILKRVVEGARDLCASDLAAIALREPGSETAVVRQWVGSPPAGAGETVKPGEGVSGRVLLTGMPLWTGHRASDAPSSAAVGGKRPFEDGLPAEMAVPIQGEERVEGVLSVQQRSRRRFSDRDAATLARLADHAAIAIRNVQLYRRLESRAARLRTLASVSQMVSSSLETDEVLRGIARAAAELMQAPFVSFWTADESAQMLTVRAVSDDAIGSDLAFTARRFGEGSVGWVAAHRVELNVPDIFVHPSFSFRDWWSGHGLRSFHGVPVVDGHGVIIGVLALCGVTPFSIGPEERGLLQSLVAETMTALEHARLYRDVRDYAERLRALEEVNRLVSSSLEMDEVLKNIAAAVARFFDSPHASLWVLDPASGRLRRSVVHGDPRIAASSPDELKVGEGGVGWVVARREPILSADIAQDPRIVDALRMLQVGLRYFTAFPIALGDRVLGAFHVNRRTPFPIAPETASLMASLAGQAAIAIDNARLYAETSRRLDESRALLEVAELLNSTLDGPRLLKRVAMKVAEVCAVDRCTIDRWDGDTVIPLMSQFADGRRRPELWEAFKQILPYRPGEIPVHARAIETARPVVVDDATTSELVPREWVEIFDLGSYMVVPLVRQGQVIGVMSLDYSGRPRPFQRWQVELATAIAGQLALAMANIQLYAEAQERLRETTALLAVGRALSRPGPLPEVMRGVAREVALAFAADMVAVFATDERREVLAPVAGYHIPKPLIDAFRDRRMVLARFPDLLAGWRAGRAVGTPDATSDPRFDPAWVEGVPPHALLLAPTMIREEAVGAIFLVWWQTGRAFSPSEVRLLEGMAAQVGLAMENAELSRQTQRKLAETEMLLSVSRALSTTLDLRALLRHFLRSVASALDADTVGVWLLDADGDTLQPVAVYRVPPERRGDLERRLSVSGHAFFAEAVQTRRAVYSTDVASDPRLPADLIARVPHRSLMFVPIVAKERVIGGFAPVWWERARTFSEGEIALVEALASQAGVAVENARLFEENRRQVAELSVLHELSRALTGQLDRAAVLDVIRTQIPRVFAVRSAAVFLVDERGEGLELAMRVRDGVQWEDLPAPYADGQGGLAPVIIASGRPLRTNDYAAECARHEVPPAAVPGFQHWMGVPMRTGDSVLGAMVLSDSGHAFTEADERLLTNVADLTALALRSARLFEDRSRAYGDLAAAQDQLVRTEKLRALGEMASGVAHDFNNLLAAILGRAQLLLKVVTDARLQKWLQVIERAALDGAQTVRRLQEFTRIRRDQPLVAVDLNHVIREALEITQSRWRDEALRRGVEVEARLLLEPLPEIAGDPVELREAMTNLILNAVDAMPAGGVLTLASSIVGDHIQVCVVDTGVGMPAAVRARIFDPFFTTKGPQGTGLGLAMTYGIISRHAGRIEVESEEGRGSTFRLLFPRAAAVEPSPPAPAAEGTRTTGLHCLVVDDEEAVGALLGDVLDAGGHTAVVCTDGEEAVQRFQAGHFDVVFTDLAMPGMSGWQVAQAIKASAPDVPVFLITGFGVELSPEECRSNGVDAVLPKPLSIEEVLSAAARAAGRRGPS